VENRELVRIRFYISSDSFPTETVHSPQLIQIKGDKKITLLAFSVQIKNVVKHDRNRV